MNLYFRFMLILWKTLFSKKQPIFAESCLTFHVLPFDCDINLHLNNARYLAFMDLGRIHLMGQGKLLIPMYKNRWAPVVTAVEMSFIKAIKPLQKFSLMTQVIGWDDNNIYMQQRFMLGNTLAATALVKGTFVINGKKCRMQDIMELVEPGVKSPSLPALIEQWKLLIDSKKATVN